MEDLVLWWCSSFLEFGGKELEVARFLGERKFISRHGLGGELEGSGGAGLCERSCPDLDFHPFW